MAYKQYVAFFLTLSQNDLFLFFCYHFLGVCQTQGSGAANRALCLPEILGLIFKHLRPRSYAQGKRVNGMNCIDDEDNDDDDDGAAFGADYAAKAALAAALASLRAAALVNRTWFTAVLPLLWRRPPCYALSEHAVFLRNRRAMYVSQIRELRVLWGDALYGAIAYAAAADAGSDANDNINNNNGHAHGSGKVAPMSADSNAIGRRRIARGAAAPLDMRRLRALTYSVHYRNLGMTGQALVEQKLLLRYLAPCLEELRCYVTHDLLYRLEVLQRQPQGMSLRTLHLNSWLSMRERLLQRLLVLLEDDQAFAPALTCLKLHFAFYNTSPETADRALHVLARRKGLRKLKPSYTRWKTSSFATLSEDMATSGPLRDAQLKGSVNTYSSADRILGHMPQTQHRRPFATLEHLEIFIDLAALPALVPLVQQLMHLDINLNEGPGSAADVDSFRLLATLTQLHRLEVSLPSLMRVSPKDMRALHRLTQLRHLALHDGSLSSQVADADVAALVRALSDLRALILHTYSGRALSDTVLRDIGLAGRNLRCISYHGWICLTQTLRPTPADTPQFPRLEQLCVSRLEHSVFR
jgi:hypothetical protein